MSFFCILTTARTKDPWDHALPRYAGSTGVTQGKTSLSLSTLVLHGDKIYAKDEWDWDNCHWMVQLQAMPEEKIQIGCWVINGSAYHRPTEMEIFYADFSKLKNSNNDRYKRTEPKLDLWYNSPLSNP